MNNITDSNKTNAPKVAILGGSFDPFHNGHLAMIERFLEHFYIQHLFLLPTFCSPFKQEGLFTPQARLAMCEAIAQYINAQKNKEILKVCDFEITQNRVVYSIESVKFLSQSTGEQKFYFLLGFDSFLSLVQWRDIIELIKRVEFVVFSRDGVDKENFSNALQSLCARLDSLNLQSKRKSQEILKAHFLPLSHNVASSSLKEDLAQFGISKIIKQIPPPLHSLLMKSAIMAQ